MTSYLFEDNNRRTLTFTEDSYRRCIQKYLLLEIEDPDMQELMWFQQDRVTNEMLKIFFPNRLISRFDDVPCSLRSRDLIPLNFFVWRD